jgi:hypothetical protein
VDANTITTEAQVAVSRKRHPEPPATLPERGGTFLFAATDQPQRALARVTASDATAFAQHQARKRRADRVVDADADVARNKRVRRQNIEDDMPAAVFDGDELVMAKQPASTAAVDDVVHGAPTVAGAFMADDRPASPEVAGVDLGDDVAAAPSAQFDLPGRGGSALVSAVTDLRLGAEVGSEAKIDDVVVDVKRPADSVVAGAEEVLEGDAPDAATPPKRRRKAPVGEGSGESAVDVVEALGAEPAATADPI